jgi:hypothetical protein
VHGALCCFVRNGLPVFPYFSPFAQAQHTSKASNMGLALARLRCMLPEGTTSSEWRLL